MPRTRHYYVYIMANEAKMIYTGVTNDIERRVLEHKAKLQDGFTKRYNMTRLVYMRTTTTSSMRCNERSRSRAGFAGRRSRSSRTTIRCGKI
jgi:predicted GIY-YIG superfamily endonuclease